MLHADGRKEEELEVIFLPSNVEYYLRFQGSMNHILDSLALYTLENGALTW